MIILEPATTLPFLENEKIVSVKQLSSADRLDIIQIDLLGNDDSYYAEDVNSADIFSEVRIRIFSCDSFFIRIILMWHSRASFLVL